MMGLDERFSYLILGLLIGFVFGYFTRRLQKIEEKVNHVDKLITKDEQGSIRLPQFMWLRSKIPEPIKARLRRVQYKNVMLFVVVMLVAFSSFQSQRASNKSDRTTYAVAAASVQTQKFTYCNQIFLGNVIVALNERTTYSKDATAANIALQKAFATFITVITFQPPKSQKEQTDAFNLYFTKLKNFVELSDKASKKADAFSYPTVIEFTSCLDRSLSSIKKEVDNG